LLVSGLIRSNIDALDNHLKGLLHDPEDESAIGHKITAAFDSSKYDKFRELGSGLKPSTFSEIEAAHQGDLAFRRFRLNLGEFLTKFLGAYEISLPDGKEIKFHANDLVYCLISMPVLVLIKKFR
jgi:hypothetical protein